MNDELISLLRQHDPASGKTLTSYDRARILERAQGARRRLLGRRWLTSLALAAVVIFVAALAVIRREASAPAHVQTARQLQYATPGGTRIVWTLDPNFHM